MKKKELMKRILAMMLCVAMLLGTNVSAMADDTVSGGDAGVLQTVCEICEEVECVCQKACEECGEVECVCPKACDDCGEVECICPKACETCGEVTCVCGLASVPALVNTCLICNVDPCTCEAAGDTTETCTCGNPDCTCEECEGETCTCAAEILSTEDTGVCDICEKGAEACSCTTLTCDLKDAGEKITETITVAGPGLSNKTLTVTPANSDEVLKALKNALPEYAVESYLAYDFVFEDVVTEEGEGNTSVAQETEESKCVKVTVTFGEHKPAGTLQVMHLAGNGVEEVEASKVNVLYTEDESAITGVEFEADSFSIYAIVWVSDVVTVTGPIVDLTGVEIAGTQDMKIELPTDGSEITMDEISKLVVETNTGTEEEPVISTMDYELDNVRWIDSVGTATDIYVYSLKYNPIEERIEFRESADSAWSYLDSSYTLRFMYEKATKTISGHEIVLVDGGNAVKSQTVDITFYNNEVVNLGEGQTNLFDENTKSYVTLNDKELGNTIEFDGVTYMYKRAVMYDSKTNVYEENDNAIRLYELQLVNETLKQRVSNNNSLHDFSEESKIVFVYCRADVEELRITAKFANADMTDTLAIADVVIPVIKKAGEVVTAEEDYQTFAEYTDVNREDSKNLIEIDGVIYQFDGAYVTAAGLNYWEYNATNTKIDALRIFGDELQFRTAGTSTWTDMKETSADTYNLFLVYKEQKGVSKTITLTAVLADASNTNLDTVKVTLRKKQLEDGTFAPTAAVSIEELVANGTIEPSYEIDGVEYKFQNAVLVSKLSNFTRQTYYTAVNNTKNVSASSINVLVQGLQLNDTQLQYQYAPNTVFDINDRHIVLVYAEDLHKVETIDSKALGVTIRMVNFKDVQTNFGGPYAENVGRTAGLLTNTTTNGYPSTTQLGTKNFSFEKWFGADAATRSDKDTNVATVQEANYLFLKKYYDESGTFHYSGFENYASMDQSTGDFTVYEEIGASSAISNSYSHKRGHFLPYNSIAPGQFSSNTNLYDPMGKLLPTDASRYNENLYVTKETVDYNFGMYLEAEFAQPNNGIYRGEQMVFEFNGDDDFWVYLDGVLVLDIGGIHNAQSGYINFATGEVVVKALPKGTGTQTTIKQMFINALGKTGVNDYNFKGNTFADGSLHKMQVFYMERGKSASNLYLNFNLPTVPSGTIQVEKQLGNTDQEAYTDLPFAFRVMAQKIVDRDEALDANGKHVWIEKYAENEYEPLGAESGAYVGSEKNKLEISPEGIFTLKPTEVANFPNIQADRKYYVEEVNLAQLQKENKVIVASDTKYTEDGKTGQENMLQGEITAKVPFMVEELIDVIKTTERAVSERKKVTFINYITDAVLGNIQIEKKISKGETNPDYGFNFKVTVQDNLTEKMVPYVGDYYLKDAEGNYLDSTGKPQNLKEDELPEAYGRTYDGVIPNVMVGQKAEVRDFYQGTSFFVEEVDLKNIYETPKITYDEDTCTVVDADGNKTYHVKGSVSALVIVTNKEKYQYDWTIFKRNKTDSSQLLAGAEFTLISADGQKTYYGKSVVDDPKTAETETGTVRWYTDSAMTTIAESISVGTYYLAETKAPVGYAVSEEVWTIVFAEEASPVVYKGKIEGEIPADAELIDNHLKEEVDDSGVRHVITEFYFMNEVLYELPSTGGPGIYWCMLSGMLLMMAGALMVYNKKCKEVLGG